MTPSDTPASAAKGKADTPTGSAPDQQGQGSFAALIPSVQTGEVAGHRVVGNIAHVSHGRSELGSLVLAAILRATGDR